mmetsp:Transcript_13530/g.34012  ORF Transcript_13530/g.34012 Transcript_13530/m.34012 type:complete len:293 (+) Transcript_13530:309-1187(+)
MKQDDKLQTPCHKRVWQDPIQPHRDSNIEIVVHGSIVILCEFLYVIGHLSHRMNDSLASRRCLALRQYRCYFAPGNIPSNHQDSLVFVVLLGSKILRMNHISGKISKFRFQGMVGRGLRAIAHHNGMKVVAGSSVFIRTTIFAARRGDSPSRLDFFDGFHFGFQTEVWIQIEFPRIGFQVRPCFCTVWVNAGIGLVVTLVAVLCVPRKVGKLHVSPSGVGAQFLPDARIVRIRIQGPTPSDATAPIKSRDDTKATGMLEFLDRCQSRWAQPNHTDGSFSRYNGTLFCHFPSH